MAIDKDKVITAIATTEGNEWADSVEIKCWLSEFQGEGINFSSLEDYEEDYDNLSLSDIIKDEGSLIAKDVDDNEIGSNKGPYDDQRIPQLKEKFECLETRSRIFGDSYPFYIDKKKKRILYKSNINKKQEAYIWLLISSNLYLLTPQVRSLCTKSFERLSFAVFQKIYEPPHIALYFGATCSDLLVQCGFQFPLWSKLKRFEELTKADLKKQVNQGDYPDNNTGDNGLDMFSYFPFQDNNNGTMLCFGQCACGSEFEYKPFEASAVRWDTFFNFKSSPITQLWIPHYYRNSDFDWEKGGTKIHGCVLFDRLRIMKLLTQFNLDLEIEDYKNVANLLCENLFLE